MNAESVGFTGTSQIGAVTAKQLKDGERLLYSLYSEGYKEFHHGDCIGADEQFHAVAKRIGFKIIIHPPENNSKRAFCFGADTVLEEKAYLIRNHAIVDETNVLIAVPKSAAEELRSGTWATVRYARKAKHRIYILMPEGYGTSRMADTFALIP